MSLSGSPVAIDVKRDITAVVAAMPKHVSQSILTMLTASVPISVTNDWHKVRNALTSADFQNDFVI